MRLKLKINLMLSMLLVTPMVCATSDMRLIVKYKNDASFLSAFSTQTAPQRQKTMQAAALLLSKNVNTSVRFIHSMSLPNHHVFAAKSRTDNIQQVIQELSVNPNVEYVEEDKRLQAFFTPNDPEYPNQWHYHSSSGGLNLPGAWDNATGSGVVVAVIDSGYRPHSDLNPNILPGYDMISDLLLANDGDLRDSDARDPGDGARAGECGINQPARNSSWHGTHVAGTVAAVTDNSTGVAGVAFNAKVVPVRILGKCGAILSDLLDAMVWAVGGSVFDVPINNNPAQVINISLGGSGACGPSMQNTINLVRNTGATIVVAAGNENDNANNFNPGNCSGVVNVAATDINAGRALYSNHGTAVTVSAPGGVMSSALDPSGIFSTSNSGTTAPGSDNYRFLSGTSMASPHVAGVAALLYQAKPDITPDDVAALLKNNTRPFGDNCTTCGTGIVDATTAVNAALNNDIDPNPEDTVLVNNIAKTGLSSAANNQLYFTFEVPENATSLSFNLSGDGDADLHVLFGSRPTTLDFDCRPYMDSSNEICEFTNPKAGTWHVMIEAFRAYNDVSLVASYKKGNGGGAGDSLEINDINASLGNWKHYSVTVPAGMNSLNITISGGAGDADLYVRYLTEPETGKFHCRPYKNGNAESCRFTTPQSGTWYIGIRAYRTFSGVTLNVNLE
ncbi:Extracellular protease precursor [hydrothermal vent metagenome]|uniref:Extracellular protease n=1 Tax=hydrothermal vent metagenome TaxID=652676 RepID=A0A3B0Z9A1_9ZZZZ